MAEYEYRRAIHKAVPGIKVLDDEPLLIEKVGGKPVLRDMPDTAKNNKVPTHLKDEWKLITDGLKSTSDQEQEGMLWSYVNGYDNDHGIVVYGNGSGYDYCGDDDNNDDIPNHLEDGRKISTINNNHSLTH